MKENQASRTPQRIGRSISGAILSLALPSALTLIVIALYNLGDAYFVASLGTDASAAVGIVFVIPILFQAVGYTLGLGGGNLLSRCLGKEDYQTAGGYATLTLGLSFLAGLLITLFGLCFRRALVSFLCATESVYQFALDYATPLLIAAIPTCPTLVLSQLLRSEGKAGWAMIGQSAGCLSNLLLDPLLIHRLGMGIAGASIATLISQSLALAILLSAYLLKKTQVRLFEKDRACTLGSIGRIVASGSPSLVRQGLLALATLLQSHASAPFGSAAVTALSVVNRLFLFVFSICLGVGQGMMPVVGYLFGRGSPQKAQKGYRFALWSSTLAMALVSIPLFLWSPFWIGIFRDDPTVVEIGARALRWLALVLFSHGIVTCTILFLQAVGRPFPATVLAAARQGIFFLPLILLLPRKFSLDGLIAVQPLADAATLLFSLPFLLFALNNSRKRKSHGKKQ